jgi:hypothetical protein
MKKQVTLIAVLFICLFSACKKDGNDPGGGGSPIKDEATARAAFLKINDLWKVTLKPLFSKTPKNFKNETISGPDGGQAVINGQYYTTRSSSSSSSYNSNWLDLDIIFTNYVAGDLKLDGRVRFYDSGDSRTACSSSGCASSSHSYISYATKDGSKNNFPPLSIRFDNYGSKISDKILFDGNKEDNMRWVMTVTNSAGQAFTFYY